MREKWLFGVWSAIPFSSYLVCIWCSVDFFPLSIPPEFVSREKRPSWLIDALHSSAWKRWCVSFPRGTCAKFNSRKKKHDWREQISCCSMGTLHNLYLMKRTLVILCAPGNLARLVAVNPPIYDVTPHPHPFSKTRRLGPHKDTGLKWSGLMFCLFFLLLQHCKNCLAKSNITIKVHV